MIKKHKHKLILIARPPRDPFLMCADCDYVNMSPTDKQLLDLRNK